MSEQGKKVYTLYNIVLALAVVIGVAVIGMILFTCVRYRKQPGDDTMPPQTHGNTTFEVIWTAIPTVIVLALFAMSFVTIRAIDKPTGDRAAIIEVRGFQWSWTFDYGTNAAGTRVVVRTLKNTDPPVMVLPVGQKVHIEQRTDNVLHSFFVPAFLFKRDLVPGKANGFDLTVTSPGEYLGQCAELCGTEHAQMTFKVRAVSRTEFDEWFNSYKPPRPECKDTGKTGPSATVRAATDAAEWLDPCVYVKAGSESTIRMENPSSLLHNLAVYEGELTGGGRSIASTGDPLQNGNDTVTVPPLQTGKDYRFYCLVHPQMEGTVVVS